MKNFRKDNEFKNFDGRSFGNKKRFSNRRSNFGQQEDRRLVDAVCDNCGRNCKVPFVPTGDKPVYCSDCYEQLGGGDRPQRRGRDFGGNRDFGGSNRRFEPKYTKDYSQDNTRSEIEALNKKLDKIIDLLMAQKPAVVTEKKVKKAKKVEAVVEETQE